MFKRDLEPTAIFHTLQFFHTPSARPFAHCAHFSRRTQANSKNLACQTLAFKKFQFARTATATITSFVTKGKLRSFSRPPPSKDLTQGLFPRQYFKFFHSRIGDAFSTKRPKEFSTIVLVFLVVSQVIVLADLKWLHSMQSRIFSPPAWLELELTCGVTTGIITGPPCKGPEHETFCRVQCFCCYQGSLYLMYPLALFFAGITFTNELFLGFLRPCIPSAKVFCLKC